MFIVHYTIQGLNYVVHFLNVKINQKWLRKLMHIFEVHSNECRCRKSGRLGLEQVRKYVRTDRQMVYLRDQMT